MKLVAIQLGHNATVALSENGVINGILSQEKCDNIKNSSNFPKDALDELLKETDWQKREIDKILIASNIVYPPQAYEYLYDSKNRIFDKSYIIRIVKLLRNNCIGKFIPWPFKWLQKIRQKSLERQGLAYLRSQLVDVGLADKPLEFVEHHLCHARAAYHSLEMKNVKQKPALVFTMDGSGDGLCATVTKVNKEGDWERIASTPAQASLGAIYSNTTRFLGMKILEHEYKVMGLAPYAKEKYMLDIYERIFKPMIWQNKENPLVFESKIETSKFYDYLVENAVGERFDNMAAALQHLTEELVTQWIRSAINATGIRRIFTGGGVFMNVKLNRCIQEMPEIEEAFFMPSCGDESNPIGACYEYAIKNNFEIKPLSNLYLGVSYSDGEIEHFIDDNNLEERYKINQHDDIEQKIAELLANREVVARFSGRCEWGARSLGNRAILAHPSYMESFYTVNDYIKSRDFWMPFAPTILDTWATRYLKSYDPMRAKAQYMITAFAATNLGVEHLRAALHQGDHTLRPQVVEEFVSPSYYRLIKCFETKTGVGAILNTSFNLHGYPLVATLEQALLTLEKSDLKFLALGSYLLTKGYL